MAYLVGRIGGAAMIRTWRIIMLGSMLLALAVLLYLLPPELRWAVAGFAAPQTGPACAERTP
jgi:hypothetical protein